jgi:ADP-heptose:LPS heptosyltransferase
LFVTIAILQYYTNVTFTEKQKEDLGKLYDLLVSSGLYTEIKNRIPISEIEYINENVEKTIVSIYAYRNSVLGIMEAINKDYNNTIFDVENIQKVLGEGKGLETVR